MSDTEQDSTEQRSRIHLSARDSDTEDKVPDNPPDEIESIDTTENTPEEKKPKRSKARVTKKKSDDEYTEGNRRRLEALAKGREKALKKRQENKEKLMKLENYDKIMDDKLSTFKELIAKDIFAKMDPLLKKFEELAETKQIDKGLVPQNREILNKIKEEEINPSLVGLEPPKPKRAAAIELPDMLKYSRVM